MSDQPTAPPPRAGVGLRPLMWGGALAALSFLGLAAYLMLAAPAPTSPAATATPAAGPPPILRYEQDGLRFTYHVPTASEGLFELGTDPDCLRNLAATRPDDTRRLRRALESELGVEDLDQLRENFSEHIEQLRGLGYL